jgi:hypothetical protein
MRIRADTIGEHPAGTYNRKEQKPLLCSNKLCRQTPSILMGLAPRTQAHWHIVPTLQFP